MQLLAVSECVVGDDAYDHQERIIRDVAEQSKHWDDKQWELSQEQANLDGLSLMNDQQYRQIIGLDGEKIEAPLGTVSHSPWPVVGPKLDDDPTSRTMPCSCCVFLIMWPLPDHVSTKDRCSC